MTQLQSSFGSHIIQCVVSCLCFEQETMFWKLWELLIHTYQHQIEMFWYILPLSSIEHIVVEHNQQNVTGQPPTSRWFVFKFFFTLLLWIKSWSIAICMLFLPCFTMWFGFVQWWLVTWWFSKMCFTKQCVCVLIGFCVGADFFRIVWQDKNSIISVTISIVVCTGAQYLSYIFLTFNHRVMTRQLFPSGFSLELLCWWSRNCSLNTVSKDLGHLC